MLNRHNDVAHEKKRGRDADTISCAVPQLIKMTDYRSAALLT